MKQCPDRPWLSEEGKEISNDALLKLYEIHSEDQISHLDSHYKYRNYYTTILAGLLAIFVGGMLQFYKQPFAPALLVILFCIAVLSEFGKRTIDRYYRRFLESIAILSKIENLLGIDDSIKTENSEFTKVLWSNDKQLIPDRWIRDRRQYETSEQFISERMKMGDNRYAHWAFSFFEITSTILALASVVVFLQIYGFETLLSFKEFFFYVSISLVIFYILYRKGSFNQVGKIKYFLLVGIGIVFPFIDIIETWIGFEHEGNPFLLWSIENLPIGYGWSLFILQHLVLSFLALYLGWKGKSQEALLPRAFLVLLDTFLVITTLGNAILLSLYRGYLIFP